jgi:hypothetical protein
MPTKEGFQEFNIQAISDGETYEQAVSLNVAGSQSIIPGISDVMLYLLIGIAVILILIILVLIIRMASRPARKAEF